MEPRDYLAMVRRWAWLLGLGFAMGAMIGMLVSAFQSPVYQASTRVLVMRAPQEKTTDYTYLSDQQLVQTYIQLLTTRPVVEGASVKLGYSINPKQITVQQIRDTQAIQVTVQDGDPQRTADIANILIQVLIEQNETIQAGRYTLTEQSIEAQITQIENQISQIQSQIDNVSAETVQQQQQQVEAQIAELTTEVNQLQLEIQQLTDSGVQTSQLSERQERLNQVQSLLGLYQQVYTDLVVLGKPVSDGEGTTRLSQMQTTLQLYQQIYINLLNNLESIRLARLQNTPNVVQIETASVPGSPVRPRPLMNTGLSALIGLLLAGGIAYLIEYVDDTIRTPEDIERILHLPVVGYIGDMRNAQSAVDEIHVFHQPRSPISEAFRSLRTNLEFANVDSSLTKILITSPGPGEGKTTVSTNLAAIIAQGGKRVLLIDADLRRPRIHTIFGMSNRVGLTTLFRGQTPLRSVMRQLVGMDGLYVITSGKLPPNPTELLASARMDQILEEAGREVDVIVIDSPPSIVADFQVLATKVDGTFLVIQPGYTHADIALGTLERLTRVNAKPLGVVLNKIPKESSHYGGYYRYQPYKAGGEYYIHEDEQQLLGEEEAVNLLPLPSQNESYFGPNDGYERFYDNQEFQRYMDVYTPKKTPASRNEITQPRKKNDSYQQVVIEPAKKKPSSRNEFHTWYQGQDEEE
jgi:capsular exopolysaccharide synthesis family protein